MTANGKLDLTRECDGQLNGVLALGEPGERGEGKRWVRAAKGAARAARGSAGASGEARGVTGKVRYLGGLTLAVNCTSAGIRLLAELFVFSIFPLRH